MIQHTYLLDIDGTLNEPQHPVGRDMLHVLYNLPNVFLVTGNTYQKTLDLGLRDFKVFCNNADELREFGEVTWRDEKTPPLPYIPPPPVDMANNSMEWRSPRFVNVIPVGRYSSHEDRDKAPTEWREDYAAFIRQVPGVEVSIGGQVSVDVYSEGADKSRSCKWLKDRGYKFTFIGDKCKPGGNDYAVVKFCQEHRENKWFETSGHEETMRILAKC